MADYRWKLILLFCNKFSMKFTDQKIMIENVWDVKKFWCCQIFYNIFRLLTKYSVKKVIIHGIFCWNIWNPERNFCCPFKGKKRNTPLCVIVRLISSFNLVQIEYLCSYFNFNIMKCKLKNYRSFWKYALVYISFFI